MATIIGNRGERLKKILIYIITVIIMLSSIFQIWGIKKVEASVTGPYSEDGDIKFESDDKAASTTTTWRLLGFIIRLDTCGYNSKSGGSSKYIEVRFNNKNVIHDYKPHPTKPGYYITNYTITEDYVLGLMKDDISKQSLYSEFRKKMSKDKLPDGTYKGGTIYLNGIFGVYYGGNFKKGPYYTLSDISHAEEWGQDTLNDFKQYFNIPVDYHPTKLEIEVPVTVEYHTSDHELMYTDNLDKVEVDKSASYTFPEEYKFKGKNYKLYRSYYINMSKPTKMLGKLKVNVDGATLSSVKKRKEIATDLKGLKFIAMYKEDDPTPSGEEIEPDAMYSPLEEPNPEAVIKADQRGNEQFDVELGIPTTENVYTNVVSENYLFSYQFTKEVMKVPYSVSASKTYNLSWTSYEKVGTNKETKEDIYDDVEKTEEYVVQAEIVVERVVAYWRINQLNVYVLDNAVIGNGALPNQLVNLTANNTKIPVIECNRSVDIKEHVLDPEGYEETMSFPAENIVGGYIKPTVSSTDLEECVEEKIGIPKVKNDKLIFDNVIVMNDTETLKEGPRPKELKESAICDNNVLYKSNIEIPRERANKEYDSTGVVIYKQIYPERNGSSGGGLGNVGIIGSGKITFEIPEVNSIVVHTPTVCNAKITDLKAYNQMVTPAVNRASLILDKSFTVSLPTTGEHNEYPGYGYRDYAKYIATRQVMFPFDVYRGTNYIRAGTWTDMVNEEETFYLPTWVTEGNYEVECKTTAINCAANNGDDLNEYVANFNIDNYSAIDSIFVQVTGRLYNLQIYDITDYPLWESVFRKENSLALTGTNYTVGIANQNGILTGRLAKYTFPLVYGSHPNKEKEGAMKLGYSTRFKLTTIGDMFETKDYIKIIPRFYYVDYHGNNRKEVDLYYTETFNGKKNYLVKVGGDKDKTNKKSFVLGNVYWQVPEKEIKATGFIDDITDNLIRSRKNEIFSFNDIQLSTTFRTYVGDSSYIPSGTIPSSVGAKKVMRSVQTWYGEYYLPSDVHVVVKDFDLKMYAKERGYIDFTEDIWLDKGYIIVNYDIVTYQTGKAQANLSYINKENALQGYCNMWKLEGSQLAKTDTYGNTFEFKYGDYVMYDTEKSAAKDYKSGGTH